MSKRRVKAVGADDEFDEFDDDVYENEEYDADAERQLKEGTSKVKAVVGEEFSEAEIRDALWHYYYDVEKSVNYLLSNRTTKPQKKSKGAAKNTNATTTKGTYTSAWCPHVLASGWPRYSPFRPRSCYNDMVDAAAAARIGVEADANGVESGRTRRDAYSRAQPTADFFHDSPWLQIPPERMANIWIEPLRPRNGLLGGASGAPKQSKLGALAAARKRKENERLGEASTPTNASVALLDKLTLKSKEAETTGSSTERGVSASQLTETRDAPEGAKRTRRYQPRRRVENEQAPVEETRAESPERAPTAPQESRLEMPILPNASSFAQTLFGTSPAGLSAEPDGPPDLYDPFPEKHAENPFAGPSPDDIVSKAQSTSKGLKNAKGTTKDASKAKDATGLSNELERAKIDDTPRVRSKNIDVVAEYEKAEKKNTANFVVIGHVDAGKSTLMGRLLHELSVVDKRTLDKYQKDASSIGKASFALAWIMDASADERSRGVTIDIAMSKFETASTVFTILDAPGHRDFVPNMIAGASRADFAVLVVDSSTNNFESGLKGQTKEHALLVRSLGVQRLIVAVNKLDAVKWSQERFDEICQQTSAFLGAAGFQTSNVMFVPCSGLQGENVTKRSDVKELSWFTGTSLLEQLEAAASPRTYPIRGPLRMPIADIMVGGTVYPLSLVGRLTSGSLQSGDNIVTIPSNTTGYIRALEVDGEPVEYAVAGQNATLHVADMDSAQLRTGDIVCSPKSPIKAQTSFSVKALAFSHLTPMFVSVIAGRADVQGRIDTLTALLDKTSGQAGKKKPRIVKPGEVARLKIAVDAEGGLPVEEGARVVLRSGGETVATGLVE